MHLQRRTLCPVGAKQNSAALHDLFHPGSWVVEAGCTPPPTHRPGVLLKGLRAHNRMAASLSTATLLPLNLGTEFVDRMTAVGCSLNPFADVAVHEILINAAMHGNLQVSAGAAAAWCDLAAREQQIEAALQDPIRASRIVTIAVGWDAHSVIAMIIDQGTGYEVAVAGPHGNGAARRAAGRGLVLARAAARVDILHGGTCARLIFERQPTAGHA